MRYTIGIAFALLASTVAFTTPARADSDCQKVGDAWMCDPPPLADPAPPPVKARCWKVNGTYFWDRELTEGVVPRGHWVNKGTGLRPKLVWICD